MHSSNQRNLRERTALRRAPGRIALLALIALSFYSVPMFAQGIDGVPLLGKIENVFLDDPLDPWSSGTIIVEGTPVIIPRNLLIDLPANRLTLQQLFAAAPPACVPNGETGLASTDLCLEGREGGYAQILANRMPSGHFIAGDVFLAKSATGEVAGALIPTTAAGFVSYIDYDQGYMVINGTLGEKPRDDGGLSTNEGFIVRLNDPDGVHSIQSGLGCDGGPNCSPDPRFTNDPENYTVAASNGYPMCIPSTSTGGNRTTGADPVTGAGDPFCPHTNRYVGGVEIRGRAITVPNSQRFMPFVIGDDFGAEGNWEEINGVRFFSTHTCGVAYGFRTLRVDTQPDYIVMVEVEWDAPGFANERNKSLFIGFSTLDESPVAVYSLHKDPVSGEDIRYPLASTIGNLDTTFHGIAPNAGGIFKLGYDIDFITGAPVNADASPCQNLLNAGFPVCPNGGTMDEEFSIMSPLSREVIGVSLHRDELLPNMEPLDVQGNIAGYGQYLTPIGVGHPEFVEIDLDLLSTGFIFAGEPWNLDRRLGPGGCLDDDNNGACDTSDPALLSLDPFPYSTLDPREQATLPGFSKDRVFAHHPFGPTDLLAWPPTTLPDPQFLSFAFAAPPGNRCGIPNELPVAQADAAGVVTNEDTPLLILSSALLANDLDADGDSLFIYHADASSTQGGTVSVEVTGDLLYSPAPNFNGTDSFQYFVSDRHGGTATALVTVTVVPVNDAPSALADDLTADILVSLTITAAQLLANDSDLDGDTISVTSISSPGDLAGTIVPSGADWTYTADLAQTGAFTETFSYDIGDGAGGSATAALRIHVGNIAPIALDDTTETTLEDVSVTLNVTVNDTDADLDTLSIVSFTQGTLGTVSLASSTSLLFVPAPEVSGTDTFTYTITDGRGAFASATVTLAVIEVNDPPVAIADFATTLEDTTVFIDVLANDSDPEGQPLTLFLDPALNIAGFNATSVDVIGGQIRYVPLPNVAIGLPDTITYSISDGVNTANGLLAISVTAVNDAPAALPDVAVTIEDNAVTINPLLNDLDIENDTLRILAVDVPANFPATVSFTFTTVTFVPDLNFFNETGVTIGYTVGDGRATTTSTITLIVIAENDAPIANNDLGNVTDEDTPITIDVLANDIDQDNDPLSVFAITPPLLGTVIVTGTGALLYTPNPNANGSEFFQYSLTDNFGGVSSATVAITINPINDAPDAGDDGPVPMAEDTVRLLTTGLLFANDLDVDADPIVISAVSISPTNGTATLVLDPSFNVIAISYTPNANFFGTDTFEYTILDPSGLDSTALVTMSVLPVNDAPEAAADVFVIDQDTNGVLSVLPNDSDIDGDALVVSAILSGPLNGSITINANNTLGYTPTAGFFGVDTIVYQISDGNGGTDQATITVVVNEVVTLNASFIRGDANTDGSLNVADPVQTLVVLFQAGPALCIASHDSNDDESINIGDIIYSLNYIFSSGQQPSAPFIFCGEDPTGGGLNCEATGLCNN